MNQRCHGRRKSVQTMVECRLMQPPPPPRTPSPRARQVLGHFRIFRKGLATGLIGLVMLCFLAPSAGDFVRDTMLDLGGTVAVRGELSAISDEFYRGRRVSVCGTWRDLENRGLSGVTCELPLSTTVGPVLLEVQGELARVRGGRLSGSRVSAFLAIGLLLLYGLVTLAFLLGGAWPGRAFRVGIPAAGTIESRQGRFVKYRFVVDGAQRLGSVVTGADGDELRVGAAVTVLHLPGSKVTTLWIE